MNVEDIPLPDNVCDYTDQSDTYIPSTATNFESIASLTDASSAQSHSVPDCSSPVFALTSRESDNEYFQLKGQRQGMSINMSKLYEFDRVTIYHSLSLGHINYMFIILKHWKTAQSMNMAIMLAANFTFKDNGYQHQLEASYPMVNGPKIIYHLQSCLTIS